MLTIVGYSINATIVIFDRIRENLGTMLKKDSLEELVNRSISQTLTRSIFTSLTTFIMVAALFILGVTSIREFALPLMVGIVCGTYSSVCITGALWYVLRTKVHRKEVAPAKGKNKKKK
jgi:SecD/SecF fusion protein